MGLANIMNVGEGSPMWIVPGARSGYGVQFIVSLGDPDGQMTSVEADTVVAGLADALGKAGFTVGGTIRYDVSMTQT